MGVIKRLINGVKVQLAEAELDRLCDAYDYASRHGDFIATELYDEMIKRQMKKLNALEQTNRGE